jgi:hypothetical protein
MHHAFLLLHRTLETTLTAILDAARRKGLPSLLIGGNAVILLGFARNTIDVDLLVPVARRSAWLDLMRELQFRLYHGTDVFAQFEPGGHGMVSVDLMFVDENTWSRLSAQPVERAVAGHTVRIPRIEHLVPAAPAASFPAPGRRAIGRFGRGCRRAGCPGRASRGNRRGGCIAGPSRRPWAKESSGGGVFVAQDAGDEAGDGVDEDGGGDGAVGEDVVADGNFLVHQVLDDALVDALVMAAQQDEVAAAGGVAGGDGVGEAAAGGRGR